MGRTPVDGSLRPTAGSGGPQEGGGTPAGPSGGGSSAGDGKANCKSSQSPQNCGKPPATPEGLRSPNFPPGGRLLSTPTRTASKVVCVEIGRLENLVLVEPDPAPFSFPILVRGRELVAGSGRIRAAVIEGSPASLPTIDLLLLKESEAEKLVALASDLAALPEHKPSELNALASGLLDRARALLEGMQ